MWENISLGRYVSVQTFFHRLHPATKIIAMMLVAVGIFTLPGLKGLAIAVGFTVIILLMARPVLPFLFGGLRPLILIILITFIFQLLSIPGEVLFSLGYLEISRQGLERAIIITGRLVLLVILASMLTLTTSPVVLTYGLEKILNPFKKIGVPAHELAMMITIALRFVPLLLEEAQIILKAQRSRGAGFNQRGIFNKVKNLVPFLIPLLATSLRRAEELATAMEARCYCSGADRTSMNKIVVELGDYLVISVALLFFTWAIFYRVAW